MQKKITKIIITISILLILVLCFVACNIQKVDPTKIEIDSNGYWVINGKTTNVLAEGKNGIDGSTPTISINSEGYWVINGIVTTIKAEGKDGTNGTDGKDGISPTISINSNGYWVVNGKPTNVKAEAKDGINGTNGKDGVDGVSPTISIDDNGYWVINGVTTDVKAIGKDGLNGTDGKNGINGSDGLDGKDGKNIFELYKEQYGYEGNLDEWLKDVLNGTLGTAKKHTVTFDYGDFIPSSEMPTSVKVIDGRTLNLPEPEREGFDFLGWYVGNGVNDGQWLNTLVVSRDLQLVARWQAKEFEVRFESASGELLKSEIVSYGNNATAPDAPHKDGCIFDGWDGEFENVTSNRILHPVYLNIRYSITYVTNGESTLPNETYLYNEIPTAPLKPSKSGFMFVGWKLENTEDSELYAFDAPLTSDITLVAVWSDTIIITDVEGLRAIGNNLNANYSLGRNINLNGEEWRPLGEFKGSLDGKGYKIYNFVMNTATNEMGFFKKNSGTIKNVIFSDISISNAYNDVSNTAIVTAVNYGVISSVTVKESTIQRSYSNNDVNHNGITTGGFVGTNNGTIKDSSIDISISLNIIAKSNAYREERQSTLFLGGITGINNKIIENVDIQISVSYKGTANSDRYRDYMNFYEIIGGVIGQNNGQCALVNANVTLGLSFIGEGQYNPVHYRRIGGMVGENRGELTNSYSFGTMSLINSGNNINEGSNNCGGIVGVNRNKVQSCKSSIYMENKSNCGASYGGIIGYNDTNAKVSDCLFDGELKLSGATGGLSGIVGNAYSGIISNCIMTGTIICNSSQKLGAIAGNLNNATIARCIIDGNIIVASSGTPQYISPEYSSNKTVTKCYRTENAIMTVGGNTVEGSQGGIAVLKPSEDIYTAEFFYETMLFNEDIWAIKPDGSGVHLKTLK